MTYRLMPQPLHVTYTGKSCSLSQAFTPSGSRNVLEALSAALSEVPVKNGACAIEFSLEEGYVHEGYSLIVDENGAHIIASDHAGLFYGLQTLSQMLLQTEGNQLEGVIINDKPSLVMRANLLDLRFQSFRMDYILEYVRKIAALKINCLHIDYSDRFPYWGKYKCIRDRDAFTAEEINRLVTCCRDHFIEIVPVVQSFGHMEYVLSHPEFSYLAENIEGGNPYRSQCCPLKDEALTLSKELILQVYEVHNRPRYLSIGGDETFYLGQCPQCKEYADARGKGALYLKRINELIDYVCSLGATPITYADIVLAYPETVDNLDKRAVIGDWDYDTGNGVCDEFMDWQTKVRRLADDLPDLEEPLRSVAREHLLMEDGKHFHPFGYLKYLNEKGFSVIGHCASACVGPDDLWTPNYTFHVPNIIGYAAAAVKWGSLGLVNCCWETFLFETVWYGLYCGAECFWRGVLESDPEARFVLLHYGIDDPTLVTAMYNLSKPYTMVEKRWPKVKTVDHGRVELPLEQIYQNQELLGNIKRSMDTFSRYLEIAPRGAFSLKEWLLGGKIKLFWLEMAKVYDLAMKNPNDMLGLEMALADLEERKVALKKESLVLHNPVMPVEWIITRFDKAFAKLEILSAELREHDYRIGKNRR